MTRILLISLSILCCLSSVACKAIQEPWAWLDEPENQAWTEFRIEVFGRTVHFSVPDNPNRMGTNAIRTMNLEKDRDDVVITVPLEFWSVRAKRITGFEWERYWGGYFKEDVRNYSMSVWVEYVGEDARLLDETVEERMERITAQFYSYFDDDDYDRWMKGLFSVEPYTSSQGSLWTLQNSPPRVRKFEDFRIPITDHHELQFSFYYRMDDEKPKNDEAWYERRKKLTRKILDTVRITPELNSPGT